MEPLRKKVKLNMDESDNVEHLEERPSRRPISPPRKQSAVLDASSPVRRTQSPPRKLNVAKFGSIFIPSPVQLNNIVELPAMSNVDTVSLRDILGDPLISECWLFNYLFDVDFLMDQFDEDVRDMIQIKLVHGSWKREDSNKIHIDEAVKRHANIQSITAHMPEAYGTHHSKMIVLFRHDDQAQVILLTANFVAGDWSMSQAIWQSPLLPLQADGTTSVAPSTLPLPTIGSGERFKTDLLAYFRGYSKLAKLIERLRLYNFSAVRGALVASLPRKQKLEILDEEPHLWGLSGLKRVLRSIPSSHVSKAVNTVPDDLASETKTTSKSPGPTTRKPHIVIQISSVATIGDKWPREFLLPTLSTISNTPPNPLPRPQFSIVFPTADEMRRSINGYGSGGSIHMRTQSAAQIKQLDHLRPMLCHWAGDQHTLPSNSNPIREAGRRRAAPHIKTYIRFSDSTMTRIDWAMMTSANLSNQAWGSETKAGEVRVCSYEIGVVVWPALWDDEDGGRKAEMVPVFKQDTPEEVEKEEGVIRVGWRMPYDLPLVPYTEDEMPWCASAPCPEPDWMGRSWPGFGAG